MYAKFFLFSITLGLFIRLLLGLLFDVYGFQKRVDFALQREYLEQSIQGVTEAIERIQSFEAVVPFEEISSLGAVDPSDRVIPKLYEQELRLLHIPSYEEVIPYDTKYRNYLQNLLWISVLLIFIILCIVQQKKRSIPARLLKEHGEEHLQSL